MGGEGSSRLKGERLNLIKNFGSESIVRGEICVDPRTRPGCVERRERSDKSSMAQVAGPVYDKMSLTLKCMTMSAGV
jgi:hypothetical protein